MKTILLLLSVVPLSQAQTISGERIRAHVRFLSSDLLEGRGVAVRGGALAAEYIATQFALLGARPAGDNGTYFQKVPLVGVQTAPDATLSAAGSGQTVSFRWLEDFVGVDRRQKPAENFDAEAIFLGPGILPPELSLGGFTDVDVK